jgi:proteasome component ECM29
MMLSNAYFYQYEKYLGDIWSASFKVMDDIKDSVRKAAMSLCRILTATLVRNVESGASAKNSDIMLRNVMPFLESQLEASAEEVQLFALKTLLDLVKKGGPMLRPYVPDLVERLLALLSSLEPQEINYLHLNASKYNLTEEKVRRLDTKLDKIDKFID